MNSVTLEHVARALSLTVVSVSVLFIGAVTCVAISICVVNKFGEDDDTN